MEKRVRITLLGSHIGLSPKHRATLRSLGLIRIRQSVEARWSESLQGALRKVGHVVKVEELEEE